MRVGSFRSGSQRSQGGQAVKLGTSQGVALDFLVGLVSLSLFSLVIKTWRTPGDDAARRNLFGFQATLATCRRCTSVNFTCSMTPQVSRYRFHACERLRASRTASDQGISEFLDRRRATHFIRLVFTSNQQRAQKTPTKIFQDTAPYRLQSSKHLVINVLFGFFHRRYFGPYSLSTSFWSGAS